VVKESAAWWNWLVLLVTQFRDETVGRGRGGKYPFDPCMDFLSRLTLNTHFELSKSRKICLTTMVN
jgi:hypothetical protein